MKSDACESENDVQVVISPKSMKSSQADRSEQFNALASYRSNSEYHHR